MSFTIQDVFGWYMLGAFGFGLYRLGRWILESPKLIAYALFTFALASLLTSLLGEWMYQEVVRDCHDCGMTSEAIRGRAGLCASAAFVIALVFIPMLVVPLLDRFITPLLERYVVEPLVRKYNDYRDAFAVFIVDLSFS